MPDEVWIGEFRSTLERGARELAARSQAASERRPKPGTWSAKEVLGHLIDSAANNHARFVRASIGGDLVFDGYEQESWVRVQNPQSAPWNELVELWRLANLHIARAMAAAPLAERTRLRHPHSLDRIAWRTVPASEPTTLDYLMRDYIAHLEHHLRQALERSA